MEFKLSVNDLEKILEDAKHNAKYDDMKQIINFSIKGNTCRAYQDCIYAECNDKTLMYIALSKLD